MKRVVILQPSYIPWIGYFDQIQRADTFVFYDDVQYTRRDWRNRNRIMLNSGEPGYLTIPVCAKGNYSSLIKDIKMDMSQKWQKKHLNALTHSYKKTPYFDEVYPVVLKVFGAGHQLLSTFAIEFTRSLAQYLEMDTTFVRSSDVAVTYQDPTDHLVQICKQLGATHYLTGDSAQNYLDESLFTSQNIRVEYQNYVHPAYDQRGAKEFISHLSILDLLFNCGKSSRNIISNVSVQQGGNQATVKSSV